MDLNKAIQERRSIRKYKNKATSWKVILEALDSTLYAPTAGGVFPLKIMLIDDDEKIKKIAKWSEQDFITQAKYVVVFTSNSTKLKRSYGEKAKTFCKQQTGAAIQNFLLKLTELKLATCWIGYFNEENIKPILKIPDSHDIEAIFPIGIANEKPKHRISRELGTYLYFNTWGNDRMKRPERGESRMPGGFGWDIAKDT